MAFRGILIEKSAQGAQHASLRELDLAQLPPGEVTVRISYSTLNFKDALAITGQSPVVRAFPLVPGIDFAGTVEHSTHADFRPGDRVIGGGAGIGESAWGGLAELARVHADGLVLLPSSLSARDAMAIGTAGFTAMLCVMGLEAHGVLPEKGPVLVTGASGGVGSFSVSLLARLGYRVIASTGRLAEAPYLQALGASEIIDRSELSSPGKALGKERWAGAIDSVGSHTLANACACTMRGGSVAACGLAQGMDFPATVAPFILRGVNLLGVDTPGKSRAERTVTWQRLASLAEPSWFRDIAAPEKDIPLDAAIAAAKTVLAGQVRGRLVVQVKQEHSQEYA
ncbi:MAG TPA: MDR family oxidoreductase [Polyangiaceae bacterium]|nr:MDR family oxidoreductase [Polyangiaceae bacterium]